MNLDNVYEGAKMAFGQPVETRYDFEKADVIVSLDADFLYAGFPVTRYIRDFAKRRDPDSGNMNRLYVVESTMSSTEQRRTIVFQCGRAKSRDFRLPFRPLGRHGHRRFSRRCPYVSMAYGSRSARPSWI